MKRLILWMMVVAVVLAVIGMTLSALAAQGGSMSAEGKEINMVGRLSCTFCTLSHPGKACPKGCCEKCIKAGDPPLLTDAKGNVYLLVTAEMQGTLMTPDRMAMAGKKVAVKGLLVKAKGLQAIIVDSMQKAQ